MHGESGLAPMAEQAREVTGIKDLTVVADRGYFKGEQNWIANKPKAKHRFPIRFQQLIHEELINVRTALISDSSNRCQQREDHVVVLHREQITLPCVKPASRGGALALRAMTIAAGIVGNLLAPATLTAQYMPTPRRGTARWPT